MDYVENENVTRNDGVLNNHEEHRHTSNTPKNGSVMFYDERTICRCGAKKHVDKYKRELERKSNALERDKQYVRQQLQDVERREKQVTEASNQISIQQEQLDSYRIYLQEKQIKISRMYQNYEQWQSDLMQKMDECIALEKEYKNRLTENEKVMYELNQREYVVSETSGALSAKKEELEKFENKILQESEKIKFLNVQCESAKERMHQELKNHNKRLREETEDLEARKRRLTEQEVRLRDERDKLESSKIKEFELDRKLKEATEIVENNARLADDLKHKEDALRKEKELIVKEWSKLNESVEQLNNDRNELKSIKMNLEMRSKRLELSESRSDVNLNDSRYKNMDNEFNRKFEYLNNKELVMKNKELELEKMETELNKRKLELDERESGLKAARADLDKRAKEIEHKNEKNRRLEPQINEYKDKMALLSIERNSLDGQIEQFNAKRMNAQREVDAINQRLSLREKQINDKYNQLKGRQTHSELYNKLNASTGTRRPTPFNIADDRALN
ncbi:hypothetical protein MACJ_001897 [Theileria orientalis]|uniref:Uncharacterized protein n=1 Tax=Theileria orientalis TaxID=68886 RepID=A0A976M7L7_THEOR|nr:hypothetical protein MACJ_001897 [Theileria orientalis]